MNLEPFRPTIRTASPTNIPPARSTNRGIIAPKQNEPIMANPFFEHPILNSPYACPRRHWELDDQGQPTQKIIDVCRRADFITPISKPKKRRGRSGAQQNLVFNEGLGLSSQEQQYDTTSIINEVRGHVDPQPLASMEPRSFNRGNQARSFLAAPRVLASMEPRSFNCGNKRSTTSRTTTC